MTNYRDFVLVGRDAEGHPAKLETYRLAESESAFWEAAQHPHLFADVHGERFIEYLKRVMLHAAPLASPADVAWFLASYARDAKARSERAAVYLTNALTGWQPPKGAKKQLTFPEMEEERDAAEHVKRDVPILVVLGNPPYNAFAGVSPDEEQGLVEPYKQGLISEWGIKKFNLDDLYIRFFRLAERRIAERTGEGVVCYISNFSYLSDPSSS